MKVTSVKIKKSPQPCKVIDTYVDNGYFQSESGSLPDVDIDYPSDKRQQVKEYIERRYNHDGKQRVFSAGTFTTLKMKAVLKDIARNYRIPSKYINYITAIIEEDKSTWTDLFLLGFKVKKIRDFINSYPQLIEEIRPLMNQPRSSSIHASALLVTPDLKDGKEAECFDFTPIKKVDGVLVSEFDGYSLDEQGLLKNDCLATKELSKLKETIDICNSVYGAGISLESIAKSGLDDKKVYEQLENGYTQNIFQFSSSGITKLLKSMHPDCIDDLIACNAMYRPAALEAKSDKRYVDCKQGTAATYLWGTYNSLKSTYSALLYQEQLAQIAREVGGFSLGEGVKLVKFISKKKVDKIRHMKEKFMEGAINKGCPQNDADGIWEMMEAGGTYLFNKSHSTAYAITSYVGAWLKCHYPLAFYTIALEWGKEEDIVTIMSEMELCSNAKIVPPDINVSGKEFCTDYNDNEIFWSLTRIKQVGLKAVEYIIRERDARGKFSSMENFIERVFKYKLKKYQYWDDPDNPDEETKCPVNARHVKNMVIAGCFDEIEEVKSVVERYSVLQKAAKCLGFEIKEKEIPEYLRDKHYFWSQQQIAVSGIGSIDYERMYDNSSLKGYYHSKYPYRSLSDCKEDVCDGKRVMITASIAEIEEKSFNDKNTGEKKKFCKILLQQNNDTMELIAWDKEWEQAKPKFEIEGSISNSTNKVIVAMALCKFSEYSDSNMLQFTQNTEIELI